jgi:drug/metabolite transporter (DMT)-like permease
MTGLARQPRQAALGIALAYAALCLLPSTTWIAIKIGLSGAPPLAGAGLRFVVAAGCLFSYRAIRREPVPVDRSVWSHIALVGALMFAIPYGLIYVAETHITSGLAAVLFGTMPLFVVLVAHRMGRREPITVSRLAGVVVGIVGLVIVFRGALEISSSTTSLMAMLGVACAALTSGVGQVRIRARPTAVSTPLLIAWGCLCSGVALCLLGAATEGFNVALNLRTVGSIVYLGTTAATGFYCMFWLLSRISAVSVSLHALVVPVLALVWGALFYGEPVTIALAAGTAVICGGVALVTLGGLRRRPASNEMVEVA